MDDDTVPWQAVLMGRAYLLRHQIHPPQQVLEARVVAEGVELVGGHQAVEFFKPVEDDVDLGLCSTRIVVVCPPSAPKTRLARPRSAQTPLSSAS